jgi:putative tricarboxylic transport membrane protein
MTQKQRARTVVSGILLLLAIGYFMRADDYSFGSLNRPGPGVWPVAVGSAAIVIFSIALLESLLRHEAGKSVQVELPSGVDARRALRFTVVTILYVASFGPFGFLYPTLLMTAYLLYSLAEYSKAKSFLLSGALVGTIYLGFARGLGTRFPQGTVIQQLVRTFGG